MNTTTTHTTTVTLAEGWADKDSSRFRVTCTCGTRIGDKYGYAGRVRANNVAAKHEATHVTEAPAEEITPNPIPSVSETYLRAARRAIHTAVEYAGDREVEASNGRYAYAKAEMVLAEPTATLREKERAAYYLEEAEYLISGMSNQ